MKGTAASLLLAATVVFGGVACVWSAVVDRDAARGFAARWRGRTTRAARTLTDADGQDVLHVVRFDGGGFAVVGADDALAPVVVIADQGEDLIEDDRNPLWALVKRQAALRSAWRTRRGTGAGATRHHGWNRARGASGGARLKMVEASGMKTASATTCFSATDTIEDVRVAPLLRSTWDQKTVGGYSNTAMCYNYYTPNNYYCGCVATAVAQIMRYHEWPKTAVTPHTYTCKVGETEVDKTMIGGVYNWDLMTLVPSSSPLTPEVNRREISKLCYDVGVAVHMQWMAGGSGAFLFFAPDALRTEFGYASANVVCYNEKGHAFNLEEFRTLIRMNCDAGLPLAYGISGASGGHAVVIDGYGYSGDDFFIHINPGWSGNANAWYCPPDLTMKPNGATTFYFDSSDELVFNIMPRDTGAIVSGRVLTEDGEPVAGAAVSGYAVYQTSGFFFRRVYTNQIARVFSNAKGVYAVLTGCKEACTVYLTAEKWCETRKTPLAQKACCTMIADSKQPFSGSYTIPASFTVGNKTDVDLVLPRAEVTMRTEEPVPFKWLAAHYPQLDTTDRAACESLAQTLGANGAAIWKSYVLGLDPTDADARFRLVLDWQAGRPVVRHNIDNLLWGWRIAIEGSTDLNDWQAVDYTRHNFFKARVTKENRDNGTD